MFFSLFNQKNLVLFLLVTCILCIGIACGDDDGISGIEVEGQWQTQFDTTEVVTEQKWETASIIIYDNEKNWTVTQMPESDAFNPGKFSKIVWTEISDNIFYYCTIDFGKDTAEDAQNTLKTADARDLTQGCSGFSWTKMTLK